MAESDSKPYGIILNPKFGYNLRPGGLSATFSEETRAVMSAKKKGRKRTFRKGFCGQKRRSAFCAAPRKLV